MVRVCTDTLINEKNPDRNGFYMDAVLKENLDILIKNIKNDWDFCMIISGSGRVRVGKSLLALQIAYYWVDQIKKVHDIIVPFTVEDNIVFRGSDLISKGNSIGINHPYSPLIFDEAGADLEGVKAMKRTTQDVKDFLRECGQYNLLTILVLPDFFDLPRGVALSRSDCLIDVFTMANDRGMFERGFFNFYSRPTKKMLWLKGKKELNYKAWKYDFHGRYYNNYPINEEQYRKAKMEAMKHRELDSLTSKYQYQKNVLLRILNEEAGFSHQKIADTFKKYGISVARQTITDILAISRGQNYKEIVLQDKDLVDVVES